MMGVQAALFLAMVVCGAVLAVLFDFLRAVRMTFKPGAVITGVTDVIFVAVSVMSVIYCVWEYGNGQPRYYEILGLAVGAALYFLVFSRFLLRLFSYLMKIFSEFIRFILKILLTPPRFLYKILIVYVHKKRTEEKISGEKVSKCRKKTEIK